MARRVAWQTAYLGAFNAKPTDNVMWELVTRGCSRRAHDRERWDKPNEAAVTAQPLRPQI